jgi:hypothetical protein
MKLSTDKGTENKYWNRSLISLMAPQITQLEKHLIIYKIRFTQRHIKNHSYNNN